MHFRTKEEVEMSEYVGCMAQKKDEKSCMYQANIIMKLERQVENLTMNVNSGKVLSTLGEGILISKDKKETVDLQ